MADLPFTLAGLPNTLDERPTKAGRYPPETEVLPFVAAMNHSRAEPVNSALDASTRSVAALGRAAALRGRRVVCRGIRKLMKQPETARA
ncbi:MAG: hypothetical protein LBD24_05890 [Spirochaetaceae bacterium]|nr:hypothetical protein [Spirochaetaceae bacterium]